MSKKSRVTVALADDLGIDVGAKWATICEKHNTMVGSASKKLAQATARSTFDWCDGCRREAESK